MVFGFIRRELEPTGEYRFLDSVTRIGITHKPTNTRLRVISSNGKTAMGLVNVGVAVADEPGSWEIGGGQLMWDALTGALGKPGSKMRIIVIGTLAPAATGSGHWWYDLIHDGSKQSTYVMALQGTAESWDSWSTIRRANPLTAIDAGFRKKLLEERDAARLDSRLRARFLSYRLNLPSADEAEVLLTTDDWKQVERRQVPDRVGRPYVGIDLGGGRAWSAAVAVWKNGRTEAIAVTPGIPSLEDQERRDRVPRGTYASLYDDGQLEVAEGLKVQPPRMLWDFIMERWGRPALVICDRFRLAELEDAINHQARIEPRITRWSEASYDIRALRKLAKDGPLPVSDDSRMLIATSLSRAMVKNDDAGNVRQVKHGVNNVSRDDVAQALTYAAGAFERNPQPRSVRSLGLA